MPKKLMVILSIIAVLIFFYGDIVYGQEKITLKVNDQIITEDLSYKIIDDNILIPLDIITDNLDLRVRFFRSIDTWQLENDDKEIKLRIGDRNLQVNNSVIEMPAATRLVNGQVMVPLNPIGDALGLLIRADAEGRTLHILDRTSSLDSIGHLSNESYEGIKVKVSKEVDYSVKTLKDPYRLVIDLDETTIYEEIEKIDLESDLIRDVRVSQLNSSTSRVVLDLFSNLDYSVEETKEEDGYAFIVKVSPIIKDIVYNEERFNIYPTSPIKDFELKYLTDPSRAVIDLKNTAIEKSRSIDIDNKVIERARISQYETDPDNIVRAVLDLKDDIKVRVVNNKKFLTIIPVKSSLVDIEYDDSRRELAFELTEEVKPRIIPLEKGSRLIFDFPFTKREINKDLISLNNDFINSIRISQFTDDTTRVVLDMVSLSSYDLKWEDNTLLFRPDNRLVDAELKAKEEGVDLNLSLSDEVSYGVYKLPNPNRLIVDIFDAIVQEDQVRGFEEIEVVNSARVSQYTNNPKQVRVVLDLIDDVEFEVLSEDLTKDIQVSFDTKSRLVERRKKQDIFEEKVIVIDPGHGGSDPGAIGFTGLLEKEVALDISLILQDLLEDAGATVFMTRKGDYFVDLEDRAKLTNSIEPDIFISVHANSHPERRHKGTETYVKRNPDNESLLLANLIQSYKVENLATVDRGVKHNNLYVLNHIDVPSVLSEIAFLSNPEDEALLRSRSFRKKAAMSLYKGIKDYFEYN
ncbi:N-acetylmuramoyl-L-alanine amidase [Halonatronum saccharophilum]|uniref:N-acetylmuramoyl-L-alanine amidase n=1 Tax=Halonatronum saccharophilum TaxID=150060 RepID=UPI0004AFB511|nr:N-acetylmuramoyl-L-alanine amidase [Halonatronum saccharophilum]